MKKWLSVLAVVMALCLLPVWAMAGIKNIGENEKIVSGDNPVSSSITFNNNNVPGKLTFEKGSNLTFDFEYAYIYNQSSQPLYISMHNSVINGYKEAIVSYDDLYITGRGSNIITITNPYSEINFIDCDGDITIEAIDGTITIQAEDLDIQAPDEESAPIAVLADNVYLGGGVILEGGKDSRYNKDGDAVHARDHIYIKAEPSMGVFVYTGDSEADAQMVTGSPFANGADITDLVEDYHYIRTESVSISAGVPGGPADPEVPAAPAAPSAPQTGDSANLALWACLLVVSVLGMAGMKRKAKRS